MRRTCLLVAALFCLAGCPPGGPGGNIPPPTARVDNVYVSVPAAPLRPLSSQPGDVGLLVEVTFARVDQRRGMPVSGSLEVLLFPGAVSQAEALQKKPARVQTYPNALLCEAEGFTTFFGVSYRLLVPLGPDLADPEKVPKISVVGRYIPPSGPPVFSEPTTVPMRPS